MSRKDVCSLKDGASCRGSLFCEWGVPSLAVNLGAGKKQPFGGIASPTHDLKQLSKPSDPEHPTLSPQKFRQEP